MPTQQLKCLQLPQININSCLNSTMSEIETECMCFFHMYVCVCIGTYPRGSTTKEGLHPQQRLGLDATPSLHPVLAHTHTHRLDYCKSFISNNLRYKTYTNPAATNIEKLRTEMGFPIYIFACYLSLLDLGHFCSKYCLRLLITMAVTA